jgi:hypothetical protein
VAVTVDGGKSWEIVPAALNVAGFRSVVQFVTLPGVASAALLAVGPSGADVSLTGGRSWEEVPTPWRGLHTFSQADAAARGFSAGGAGGIASLELASLRLNAPRL